MTNHHPCTLCLGHGRIAFFSARDRASGLWNRHEMLDRNSSWPDPAEVSMGFRHCPGCEGRGIAPPGDPVLIQARDVARHGAPAGPGSA